MDQSRARAKAAPARTNPGALGTLIQAARRTNSHGRRLEAVPAAPRPAAHREAPAPRRPGSGKTGTAVLLVWLLVFGLVFGLVFPRTRLWGCACLILGLDRLAAGGFLSWDKIRA